MKTEGKIWIIYDGLRNKKSKPLSVLQAQMILLTLKSAQLNSYFIWTPGWTEWQLVPQFLNSNQKYFTATLPPEPLLKPPQKEEDKTVAIANLKAMVNEELTASRFYTKVDGPEEKIPAGNVDYGYYYNEFNGDDLSLSGLPAKPQLEIILSRAALGSPADRRRALRHDFRIEVILLSKKGTSFRTFSKNISVAGTLLADEIPKDFFYRPFEMILVNRLEKDPRRNRVHMQGRIIGDLQDPRRLSFVDPGEEASLRLAQLIADYDLEQKRYRKNII